MRLLIFSDQIHPSVIRDRLLTAPGFGCLFASSLNDVRHMWFRNRKCSSTQ